MNEIDLNNEIVEWHKQTFPDCTMESQLLKLDEELKEAATAPSISEKEKEFADVYIVSLVLARRFDSAIGHEFFKNMNVMDSHKLLQCVEKKMVINRNRKWIKVGGVYRHEGY